MRTRTTLVTATLVVATVLSGAGTAAAQPQTPPHALTGTAQPHDDEGGLGLGFLTGDREAGGGEGGGGGLLGGLVGGLVKTLNGLLGGLSGGGGAAPNGTAPSGNAP
jgi:hypothetical protein